MGYKFLLEYSYQHSISSKKCNEALEKYDSPREAMLALINDWLEDHYASGDFEIYDDEVDILDEWGFKGTIDEFEKEYGKDSSSGTD